MNIFPISTSILVIVDKVYDVLTEAYINDATVAMTLKDEDEVAVAGASGLSLTYVTDSDGKYRGTIPSSISLTENDLYHLDITITSSTIVRTTRISRKAKYLESLNG